MGIGGMNKKHQLSNAYRKLAVWLIMWTNTIYSVSGKCSCYSYNGRHTPLGNGRALCKGGNGDLVSLETVDEWKFIKDEIQKKSTDEGTNEWWIGLSYDNTEKHWKWLSNFTLTYNNSWQPNKPSNVEINTGALIAKEFPTNHKGSFNNVKKSSMTRGYICEYRYSEGNQACKNDNQWCSPTTSTRPPMSQTPSGFTTSVLPPSTMASKTPPLNKSTGPSSHFNQTQQTEFPVYAIIIILLVVFVIAVLLAVFVYRLKKQRELKPRNSHLCKDSPVPVRLEHNSSTNNLNDKIIYADVVNMDGKKITINCHSQADFRRAANTKTNGANTFNSNAITCCNITEEKPFDEEIAEDSRQKSWNKSSDKVKLMSDVTEARNEELATCLYANVDNENSQKTRLVYAQIGDFKESDPKSPPAKPEPYSETDYAVIVTPSVN